MGRLNGKVAFITGAARGQGRAHAVTMAREGAQIATVDLCGQVEGVPYPMATEADLEETTRLVEAEGRRCLSFTADARDSEAMRAAAQNTADQLGKIDIGVINHGIVRIGPWDTITDEDWDTMIENNLSGVWRASRAVIPHLIDAGGGALILTSSVAGLIPAHGLVSYTAAKHGVVGLAKALAVELGSQWVRVNAVCPGSVFTPMVDNQYTMDLFSGGPGGTKEKAAFASQAMQTLPVPWIEPEAVSHAMVYLASDEGKYVTGIALPVDTGSMITPPGIPPAVHTHLAELGTQLAGEPV
jgi:(+)-trans-carveol dehydrogenase